jgi:HEAT repeat protein
VGAVQQPPEKDKSGGPDADRKERQQDLPDVALVIPEDTRPEVRAILKENAINLRSNIGSERVKAAEVLGELKEQGKPVRGLLCQALLDPYEAVRVAAADALKNIDPKMQYLAIGLLTEEDASKRKELLAKIQKLEEDGEPLSRLIVHSAKRSAARNDVGTLGQELTALSHIAKNDRTACRAIILALGHSSELVRRSAIEALARMKHSGLALSSLLTLLRTETPENRVAVIRTLVAAADKTTEEMVAKAIAGQRLHKEEKVRRAVDEALNKLQYKKDY